MEVGERLTLYRKRSGLKLEEAASALGISRNTLSAYESGKSKTPLSVFIKLTKLYNCDVFDIYSVHTAVDMLSIDVSVYELFKAHARYIINCEIANDKEHLLSRMPEEYYEKRYRDYLSGIILGSEFSKAYGNIRQDFENDTEKFFDDPTAPQV